MIVKYLVLAFTVILITFALEDKSTLDGMSPQSIIYPQGCVTPNGIPPLDYGKSFRIPLIGDIFGSPFDHIDKGQEVDIRASIEGDYYSEIPFVYIVQIQNNLGSVVLLEWIQSTMPLEKRTIEEVYHGNLLKWESM